MATVGTSNEPATLTCEAFQDWARRQGREPPIIRQPVRTTLFRQGDIAETLYLICQGLVAVDYLLSSGTSMTLRVAGPGELVGRSAVVGGRYRAGVRALNRASLLVIERADLAAWMEQLAVELWLLANRFGESVEGGIRIEPKVSCQSLAQLTGRNRQSVNEALMALRRRGIVHSHYGRHTVLDPDRLYEKAEPFLAVTGE